jgi:hypothetical protein
MRVPHLPIDLGSLNKDSTPNFSPQPSATTELDHSVHIEEIPKHELGYSEHIENRGYLTSEGGSASEGNPASEEYPASVEYQSEVIKSDPTHSASRRLKDQTHAFHELLVSSDDGVGVLENSDMPSQSETSSLNALPGSTKPPNPTDPTSPTEPPGPGEMLSLSDPANPTEPPGSAKSLGPGEMRSLSDHANPTEPSPSDPGFIERKDGKKNRQSRKKHAKKTSEPCPNQSLSSDESLPVQPSDPQQTPRPSKHHNPSKPPSPSCEPGGSQDEGIDYKNRKDRKKHTKKK